MLLRHNLASYHGALGRPAQAGDLLTAVLADRQRVLGRDHPDTLCTRFVPAHWRGEAGDPAGARDACAALLSHTTRVLGPEHPTTLRAHAGLGTWTGRSGGAAGARAVLAALIDERTPGLGPARRLDRPRRPQRHGARPLPHAACRLAPRLRTGARQHLRAAEQHRPRGSASRRRRVTCPLCAGWAQSAD
ncbi:tetratricopeptide repeat protein [Amycolatopsis sp. FDAARGOS 1241]|nr:tetratricopeptide repeat protein [Amycolatopsis sp. FDAARGOS 1241]